MIRVVTILIIAFGLAGCDRKPTDPQQIEFEKKFQRDAVLVKTCPGDPRRASGPTAITQRVYRFENELWYDDADRYRRVEATPETVCNLLLPSR
jgi:hypothetical protein